MRKRGSIVAKLMAQNLSKSGFCHIITLDLHQKEIQGFFECPVDNLRKNNYLHTLPVLSTLGTSGCFVVEKDFEKIVAACIEGIWDALDF